MKNNQLRRRIAELLYKREIAKLYKDNLSALKDWPLEDVIKRVDFDPSTGDFGMYVYDLNVTPEEFEELTKKMREFAYYK